ncbi:MAG: hypothetical protein Roseis2KO_07030 [Roseivirga sp.]
MNILLTSEGIRPSKFIQALLLCSFILLPFSQLKAQNNQTEQLVWLQYKAKIGLSGPFSLTLDLQHRRQNFLEYSGQQVVRPGITYALRHGVNLTVGTALFWHNISASEAVYRFEARPYTFLEWKQPLGNLMITHRTRFELHYNRKTSNGAIEEGFDFNYRAGHKMGLAIPIRIAGTADWRLELYDEVLINFGKRITVNHLDQNRMYAGIKKLLTDDLNVKLGYMYIFVPTGNPEVRVHQHIVVLGVSQNL